MDQARVAVGLLCVLAGCEKFLGGEAPVVSARDAPKHARAGRLTLTSARILVAQGGKYDRVCTSHAPASKGGSPCVDHHFYVFPVVPDGWTAADPVPAWVSCSAQSGGTTGGPIVFEECRDWMTAYRGAVTGAVLDRLGDDTSFPNAESGWDKAGKDAVARFGLAVAPGGPVLGLVDAPAPPSPSR